MAIPNLIQPFYWEQYYSTSMGRYLARHEEAFLDQFLAASPQSRKLLDVGCGNGRFALPLAKAGHNVVGLDIDIGALAALQRRSREIPLTIGDALHFPFANGSFDCIIAIQCLVYINNFHCFLQECHRILSHGGLLIFQAINRFNYKRGLKKLTGRGTVDTSQSFNMNSREILYTATEHGFSILAVSGYNWVPFDRRSASTLVGTAAWVEQKLQLAHYYRISPWILVAAKKE